MRALDEAGRKQRDGAGQRTDHKKRPEVGTPGAKGEAEETPEEALTTPGAKDGAGLRLWMSQAARSALSSLARSLAPHRGHSLMLASTSAPQPSHVIVSIAPQC